MLTIDASVAVAAALRGESAYAVAAAALARAESAGLAMHQPATFLVEVTSAIARRTGQRALAHRMGERLLAMPKSTVHVLGREAAQAAATLAATLGLRAADAVYVATARASGCTLLTLDAELLDRAGSTIPVLTPAAWLARGELEAAYAAAAAETSPEDEAAWAQATADGLDE